MRFRSTRKVGRTLIKVVGHKKLSGANLRIGGLNKNKCDTYLKWVGIKDKLIESHLKRSSELLKLL